MIQANAGIYYIKLLRYDVKNAQRTLLGLSGRFFGFLNEKTVEKQFMGKFFQHKNLEEVPKKIVKNKL